MATIQGQERKHESRPVNDRRLGWLDALRGVAALMVVFEHALSPLFPEHRMPIKMVFEAGWYGVLVFFLVSGYIVPASLERRGSVPGFWISRFFRLYPMFAVSVAGMALLAALGWDALDGWWRTRPVALGLGHLTMLQNLFAMPNVVNVLWTLSFEMAFYLLLTAMYVLGVHRRGSRAALGFIAVAALGAGVLPSRLLTSAGPGEMLAVVLAVIALVSAGLLAVFSASGGVRRAGAIVIGLTVLTLLAVNQNYPGPWEGLFILATMFAGTVLYRAERAEISWKRASWMALVPLAGIWLAGGRPGFQAAVVAAWLTFLIGMTLRNRKMPAPLTWLGLVSYSIYLLHPLFLESAQWFWPDPAGLSISVRLGILAAVVALVLGLSALTWRFVEAPAQRLGKRLAGQWRGRREPVSGPSVR
ncbi:acyltransferase [Spongiactinospora gelatinilytica]|uniref:Acyltransferase n=1 Tax=Spongiactinospora gelatinilytica TaxID=2666298 RepID=A0A2W2G1A8_9ACTN|nr:acyltransferase [Spongiactinospora gelatinilytica]PZG41742.1 acyltransferase [Spongiactinospora gelatinilytica]